MCSGDVQHQAGSLGISMKDCEFAVEQTSSSAAQITERASPSRSLALIDPDSLPETRPGAGPGPKRGPAHVRFPYLALRKVRGLRRSLVRDCDSIRLRHQERAGRQVLNERRLPSWYGCSRCLAGAMATTNGERPLFPNFPGTMRCGAASGRGQRERQTRAGPLPEPRSSRLGAFERPFPGPRREIRGAVLAGE